MRLSTRGRYAMEAVLYLAVQKPGQPVSVRTISEETGISRQYLEHILTSLKNADLIGSERGSQGGCYLVRNPDVLTAADVIQAAEGSLASVFCVSEEQSDQSCTRSAACRTRPVWQQLDRQILHYLTLMTIGRLAAGLHVPQSGDSGSDRPAGSF